jgi:peptide deformylase
MKGEGFEARLYQHEYDHLDGILFIDRAIPGTQRLVSLEETEEDEEAQHA